MEKMVYENGTDVLIFNYVPYWKKEQNYDSYIRGKIIDSELSDDLSYHGSSWQVVNYTVLGEDGNKYYGNYKDPVIGDSFFMTDEDYITFLKGKIKSNEDVMLKMYEDNKRIKEMIENVKRYENNIDNANSFLEHGMHKETDSNDLMNDLHDEIHKKLVK